MLGPGLLLIQQVWEAPAVAFGLIRQLFRPILGVGDQAVAADAHQLHRIAEVVVQSSDLGLHMFHKWAMGTKPVSYTHLRAHETLRYLSRMPSSA